MGTGDLFMNFMPSISKGVGEVRPKRGKERQRLLEAASETRESPKKKEEE